MSSTLENRGDRELINSGRKSLDEITLNCFRCRIIEAMVIARAIYIVSSDGRATQPSASYPHILTTASSSSGSKFAFRPQ